MTTTTIVLAVLTAAAFPLLLWAIGRTVTAIASQAPQPVAGHTSTSPEGWTECRSPPWSPARTSS